MPTFRPTTFSTGKGKARIIDFPQVVDPRFNPNALALLTRDIENICRYAARYGLERDGQRIAQQLVVEVPKCGVVNPSGSTIYLMNFANQNGPCLWGDPLWSPACKAIASNAR